MATPNIHTDTTPVLDGTDPNLARSVITDAWGLYFAQGGVVMAAALRAMAAVLARDDLSLASASAAFCRPVACGPVETEVQVLRSGRRGAQVQGRLWDANGSKDSVHVAVTGVFTDPTMPGPTMAPLPRPDELRQPPPMSAEPVTADHPFPLGFLDNTEWHHAGTEMPSFEEGVVPRLALWFRFNEAPASEGDAWEPALLPIPGDSLGSALVVALGGGTEPVGSVSLQMDLQVLAPLRGTWVGMDSHCTHVGSGLASGVVHLWSEDGTHVASVTQTAMLRGLGE